VGDLDQLAGAYDLETLHQEVLTIPAICARPRRRATPR
jgi:hypothetical protein